VKNNQIIKIPKRIVIIVAVFFSCSFIFWISERPRYVDIPLNIPGNSRWTYEYTIRKHEATRSRTFILRKETQIYCNAEEIFQNLESIIKYLDENMFDLGWKKVLVSTNSSHCDYVIPESDFFDQTLISYLVTYRPNDVEPFYPFYQGEEACLAIWLVDNSCGDVYSVLLVTTNPYWFDVFTYKFTHPR
jgi:hypothetical protein